VQAEEKRHRNDKERETARQTQLMLQRRAKEAEAELREARETASVSRRDYGGVLAHQIRWVGPQGPGDRRLRTVAQPLARPPPSTPAGPRRSWTV
jgi:hypothetical protein